MLREPRSNAKPGEIQKDEKPNRFQLLKLEERIAPKSLNGRGKGQDPCHKGCGK